MRFSLPTGIRNKSRCLPHVCGRVRKTYEKLHEILLAAEIDGSTQSLDIWFDGPSSQFKNRYIANCIPLMNAAYHCQTLATSHGKSPVDGVGGVVKRAVRDMVRCRHAIDVPTFIAAYRASCGTINILT